MVAAPLRAGTSSTRAKTDEQKSPALRVTSEQPRISATIEGERADISLGLVDLDCAPRWRDETFHVVLMEVL